MVYLRYLRGLLFWAILLYALWIIFQGLFPVSESFAEMEERAELWCEKNFGPRPVPTGGKLELTEFDDCVDAEIRLYTGAAIFGPPIGVLLGGFILLLYFIYWGVRFTWKRYRRHKRMKQNPYN